MIWYRSWSKLRISCDRMWFSMFPRRVVTWARGLVLLSSQWLSTMSSILLKDKILWEVSHQVPEFLWYFYATNYSDVWPSSSRIGPKWIVFCSLITSSPGNGGRKSRRAKPLHSSDTMTSSKSEAGDAEMQYICILFSHTYTLQTRTVNC